METIPMTTQTRPFEIYTEDTLATVVLTRLQQRQRSLLHMAPPLFFFDAAGSYDGPEQQGDIRVVTTAQNTYQWLSTYGPGAITDITDKTGAGGGNRDLRVLVTRVGAMTGDIHLHFSGCSELVHEALFLLIEKSNQGSPWLTVLVDRYTASITLPKMFRSTLKVSSRPFGLAPGYAVVITSRSVEEAVLVAMQLSSSAKFPGCTEDLPRCNSPRKMKELRVDELGISPLALATKSPVGKDRKASKKEASQERTGMMCQVLKLTREEVTYLIGHNGSKIQALRQRTMANIKVVPLPAVESWLEPTATQRNGRMPQYLRVTGTVGQVRDTLREVEADVYQFRVARGNSL